MPMRISSRMARPSASSPPLVSSNIQLDRHHGLVRLVGLAGDEALRQTPRPCETRLQRDGRFDRQRFEGAEPAVDEPQPLVDRIIAVEEQPGIGGMVQALMERLEGGIGQIRDVPRIAAGIVAVGGIGEERALRHPCPGDCPATNRRPSSH